MQEKYAQIVVDINSENLDRTFQYRIPEELQGQVRPGCVIEVPFGRGNRLIRGYVVATGNTASLPPEKLKEIHGLITEGQDEEARLVALAAWIRRRYGSSMAQALHTVFPVRKKIRRPERKWLKLVAPPDQARQRLAYYREKHQRARVRVLEALLEEPVIPMELAREKLKATPDLVRKLQEQGIAEVITQSAWRNPSLRGLPSSEEEGTAGQQESLSEKAAAAILLTRGQQEIVDRVSREMNQMWQADRETGQAAPADRTDAVSCAAAPADRTDAVSCAAAPADAVNPATAAAAPAGRYLIHGVTGSGKTAVYMELIAYAQRQGKAAIMLIPEISLTWQTVMRFRRRFGERVSFIHSRLSAGERYDQYERARRGEIDIMIGPRSALFTPFSNLGIIVIDEEQEGAYQSESVPRYHAREVAMQRARMEEAALVLGSATPSMAAYYGALKGEYTLLELPQRINGEDLPQAQIVDMRQELRSGNRSILSRELCTKIQIRLDRGEQTMLFLNRRGYAGFVSCRSCGHVIKCPHCDVSLSLHKDGRMICHYCGYAQPGLSECPACGSGLLRSFRAGTQQIEEETARLFPQARLLRMDLDTTQQKDAYDRILSSFANHEADILIGTQMIVKGHDFPQVTLVGILAADLSLHVPDYRSGERTFQLITQAAGRSGRADLPGEVIVQTYSPGHYAIECAASQNYLRFYEEEMSYRQMAGYPPVGHLIAVHLSGEEEEQVSLAAEYLGKFARRMAARCQERAFGEHAAVEVLGPTDENIAKIQDQYRKILYLKGKSRALLEQIRETLEAYIAVNDGFRRIAIVYE